MLNKSSAHVIDCFNILINNYLKEYNFATIRVWTEIQVLTFEVKNFLIFYYLV